MRAIVIGAVALPLVLGGALLAAATVDPFDTSSSDADAAAVSTVGSSGTDRSEMSDELTVPVVGGNDTAIDGRRPHLTVTDGNATVILSGSLASTVSLLPMPARPLPFGASTLKAAVGMSAAVPTSAQAGNANSAIRAPFTPAPPTSAMLLHPEQPQVIPPPEAAPNDMMSVPAIPPNQATRVQGKPDRAGTPPHASENGRPAHADTTGPPPHANAGGKGAGRSWGAEVSQANTVSLPR